MDSAATRSGRPPRWRLSIATYLTLGLGGLTFVAVASVLGLTVFANFRNTTELLEDKSRMLLGAMVSRIETYLDPAEASAEHLARLLEGGEIARHDHDRLSLTLRALIGGVPQIRALLYLDRDGTEVAGLRQPTGIATTVRDWRARPLAREVVADAERRASRAPYWGPPEYSPAGTVVNLRRPVRRAGEFLGLIVAAVNIRDLSTHVAGLETEFGQNAFVLYDRHHVLAHSILMTDFPGLGPDRPLPEVDEIGDPVLAEIWREGWQDRQLIAGDGHAAGIGRRGYIFLYTELDRYGDAPWLVGSYFAEQDIATQFQRFVGAAVAGGGGLILAVASAVAFGRAVRGPVNRLADAAEAVRALDLDQVPRLPRSRFRELNAAAGAFNAMVAALRAFALYVPRDLVRRLLRSRGDVTALRSEMREVTIMFTDIVAFTSTTGRLGAEATATFLNEHFDLLTACIEAEGGTVDKFLGDGVMALWNAVETQPDHAMRAVRAAARIAAAVRGADAGGKPPVRLRVGIHSGRAVVGNIGSRSRMNYTVVGDPVNVAERLQTLGKDLLADVDVAVLLSGATRRGLDGDARLRSLGAHLLRGREQPTEVFTLDL